MLLFFIYYFHNSFFSFLFFEFNVIPSIAFLITIFFSIPIGQAALVNFKTFKTFTISIRFGLSICFGMIFSLLWGYFLSPFTIEPWPYSILLLMSFFVLFSYHYKFFINSTLNYTNSKKLKFNLSKNSLRFLFSSKSFDLVAIGIILVAIVYSFAQIASWPPAHDIIRHSSFTAMQILEGHFDG
jgi:hypothetical protein